MLPVEFDECVKLWDQEEIKKQRHDYELERFNAWLCLTPHIKNNTSQKDLFRFPWEPLQLAKIINGETNAISKTKSSARRGKQKA
jgi:hypothetical protein